MDTDKIPSFGYGVNKGGLPLSYCLSDIEDTKNITDISPRELCKIYWMLKGLEIVFEYTINGAKHSKLVYLEGDIEPRLRNNGIPRFEYSDKGCWAELEMGRIGSEDMEGNSYGMNFHFEEKDDYPSYILTTRKDWEDYRIVDQRVFSVLGSRLHIMLKVLNKKWIGSIDKFEIKEKYFIITRTQVN